LESLDRTGSRCSVLFQSDWLNINREKRKSVVPKVGLRTPNIGLAAETLFAIEEGGADFSFGNFRSSRGWLCRWGYGGGQCRVHRTLGPLANNLARGWPARLDCGTPK
jgi:hypothetical protein